MSLTAKYKFIAVTNARSGYGKLHIAKVNIETDGREYTPMMMCGCPNSSRGPNLTRGVRGATLDHVNCKNSASVVAHLKAQGKELGVVYEREPGTY